MSKKDNAALTPGEKYINWVHNFGRVGIIVIILYMLCMPVITCTVFDCFPPIASVLKGGAGVLALFIPLGISEVLSYTPIVGSACYVTFLTGNVMNLKLPCAINAMKLAKVDQSTEKGDAISTVAVAASSILTICVIAVGVVLAVPLNNSGILQNESVQVATNYMLPALFGGMFLGLLGNGGGETVIRKKLLIPALPALIVLVLGLMGIISSGMEGIAILVMLPVTLLWARFLWKKNIIKVEPNPDRVNPAEEEAATEL